MQENKDNINFRLEMTIAMISGVSFFLLFKKYQKISALEHFVKDENFYNVIDIKNNKNKFKDLNFFEQQQKENEFLTITKLLLQGQLDSQQKIQLISSQNNIQNQVISFQQEQNESFGLYNQKKQKINMAPLLILKDFNNDSTNLNCIVLKNELKNLNQLSEKSNNKPYSIFKTFSLGIANFLSLILNKQNSVKVLQENTDTFIIRSNIPCFMLADVIVNNNTGDIYIRTSKYLEKSQKALKKIISKQKLKYLLLLISLGFITYHYWSKTLSYLYLKFYNYKKYVQMKQSIKEMEKQTQKIKDIHKCVICFDRIRNIIIYPCKHVVICFYCYREMKKEITGNKCPICKTLIKQIQAITFTNI